MYIFFSKLNMHPCIEHKYNMNRYITNPNPDQHNADEQISNLGFDHFIDINDAQFYVTFHEI